MKPDRGLEAALSDLEDVVPFIVGDKHRPIAGEADRVAHASLRQINEFFRNRAPGGDFSDCAGLAKIDDEEIAVEISGRTLNAEGEFACRRHLTALKEFGLSRRRYGGDPHPKDVTTKDPADSSGVISR